MNDLRPNQERAGLAITFLWINFAILVLSLVTDSLMVNLLVKAKTGRFYIEEALQNLAGFQIVLGILLMGVYLLTIIMFIQWFRRAYFNLHTLVGNLRHTEGWAAGAWFVPFINLYYPYQIMEELFKETEGFLERTLEGYKRQFTVELVGWWWFIWILGNIFYQISFRITLKMESINGLYAATVTGIIADILFIGLTFMIVRIIRRYSQLEDILSELAFEDPGTTLPPPLPLPLPPSPVPSNPS